MIWGRREGALVLFDLFQKLCFLVSIGFGLRGFVAEGLWCVGCSWGGVI